MKKQRLSRRDFLKLAGMTGVTIPTLVGANLLYSSRGEPPKDHEIYENPLTVHVESQDNYPILLLFNDLSGSPFGLYSREILLAEGIISFDVAMLSSFDFDGLRDYDIVLLSDGPLSQEQADRISKYVFDGGSLLVMHPDARLLPILGLKDLMKSSNQKYIVMDDVHELAHGIVAVSLQYHGDANCYLLDGAQAIAWLCDKNGDARNYPAVSIHQYGKGKVCTWVYDLARSVVLTRQGNPKWANQERDGFDGIRPSDMFHGWLDLDRIEIPQADEQQRLLVNILNFFSQDYRPLPRLWYFPDMSKCMLIATSDAHQNPGWAMEKVIEHAERYGGHISIYSMPPRYSVPYRAAQKVRWWLEDVSLMDEAYFPSLSRVRDWRDRGHEFGIHPLVADGFEKGWKENWEWFTGVGYGPVSPTTRVHRILWDGWVESARLQAEYGFRMNFDFYHVGDAFKKNNGEWVYGHFTGSGLPMKFIDEDGKVINIYQQLTQLADDHILKLQWNGSVNLPAEQAIDISKSLIDRSLDGGYAAIGAIFHTDPFAVGEPWSTEEGKWMDGTLEYAASNNIPIWSSEMWLNYVESRHNASIDSIYWDSSNKTLSFSFHVPNLRFGSINILLPLIHSKHDLSSIELNKQIIIYGIQTLGSTTYACFPLRVDRGDIMVRYV